jgi:hypothetical protein
MKGVYWYTYLCCLGILTRRDDRVVEGTGLENRQVNSLVGSNPTLSANFVILARHGEVPKRLKGSVC